MLAYAAKWLSKLSTFKKYFMQLSQIKSRILRGKEPSLHLVTTNMLLQLHISTENSADREINWQRLLWTSLVIDDPVNTSVSACRGFVQSSERLNVPALTESFITLLEETSPSCKKFISSLTHLFFRLNSLLRWILFCYSCWFVPCFGQQMHIP